MRRSETVDLASDVPAVVGRRHFLALLGAGTAATAAWPGPALADAEPSGFLPPVTGPSWVFEDPPIVIDQHPDRALLDQNENPLAPSEMEREAISRTIDLANRYPDAERQLVDALAAHHQVRSANLLMGCGSTELLKVCADALMAPGRELIQGVPTYPTIERYTRVRGGEVISVPVDAGGGLDTEKMAGRLGRRTTIVYLCNPNNPTGTVLPDREVGALLQQIPERALVVVDEAYHDYVDDPAYRSLVPLSLTRPNLVVMRTFSKVYGLAGLRIGYAIGHEDTIKMLAPHRLAINLNNPGIHASLAALKDTDLYRKTVAMNARSREAIVREMPRFGGRPIPSQAGFVWIAFDRQTRPIQRALAEHNVHVRTYGHSPKHLRISTGRDSDMDRLFEAMGRVVAGRATSGA
jgi:histidinol-phosphate aminotransferase